MSVIICVRMASIVQIVVTASAASLDADFMTAAHVGICSMHAVVDVIALIAG